MIQTYILISLLGICSYEDIKCKRIDFIKLFVYGIIGMLLHLFYRSTTIYSILGGMSIGLIVMLLSKITRERIGMGDGLLLIITGIYLGMRDNIQLLLISLFIIAILALWLLVVCKKSRNHKIAYVPCLLIAYIILLYTKGQ